ncbi:MAG: chemotaxis protein CheW [Methanosarcinales archaeon]
MQEEELQLVIFRLKNEEFGVNIHQTQEIIKKPEITRVPNAPSFVEGVINLRGRIIVVIDLNKRLGLEVEGRDENSRIIIVEVDSEVVGMLVDAVTEVLRIPKSNIETAPSLVASQINIEYLQGVGKLKDRLLILLDLNKILSEEEIKQLKQAEML